VGVAGDFEKEEEEAGGDEEKEPDGNAGEFCGDGAHERAFIC